jgi:hypothetical protein
MRKTFPFEKPPHKPPRVVEAIKHEIRKYLKRERRKSLPEGVDYWDFDCRVGRSAEVAEVTHVTEITKAIDVASRADWSSVYVEILAKPGRRLSEGKPAPAAEP